MALDWGPMSFGRNPHVAKAEAAEQRAVEAGNEPAWRTAWLEAGQLWERASERETDAKRRALYADKASAARAQLDEPYVPN